MNAKQPALKTQGTSTRSKISSGMGNKPRGGGFRAKGSTGGKIGGGKMK